MLKAFDAAALGYACFIAVCTHTLWFNPGDFGSITSEVTGTYEIAASVTLCIALALSSATSIIYSKRMILTLALVGFCLVMGVQVIFLDPGIVPPNLFAAVCMGGMSGFGNGLLFACWIWLLSSRLPSQYWREIVAGSLVSSLLTMLISAVSGGILLCVLIICAGVSVTLFVNVASACTETSLTQEPADFNGGQVFKNNFRVIVCLAGLAFAFGVARAVANQSTALLNARDISSLGMLTAAALLLVFIQKKKCLS